MADSITEKGALAFSITSIFSTVATLGYMNGFVIPETNALTSAIINGGIATAAVTGSGATMWAAGYLGGKIINTAFGTQKMDDILGRVTGYGAALATAFVLASGMTAHAAELPASESVFTPAYSTFGDVQIMLPPPSTSEEGKDGQHFDYSLLNSDTVARLELTHPGKGGADTIIYDFKDEKARYFTLHVNGEDTELPPIAIKPFWDVAADELAHARVMGCKAALEKGLGDNNPYKEMSTHYLQIYCPHP